MRGKGTHRHIFFKTGKGEGKRRRGRGRVRAKVGRERKKKETREQYVLYISKRYLHFVRYRWDLENTRMREGVYSRKAAENEGFPMFRYKIQRSGVILAPPFTCVTPPDGAWHLRCTRSALRALRSAP